MSRGNCLLSSPYSQVSSSIVSIEKKRPMAVKGGEGDWMAHFTYNFDSINTIFFTIIFYWMLLCILTLIQKRNSMNMCLSSTFLWIFYIESVFYVVQWHGVCLPATSLSQVWCEGWNLEVSRAAWQGTHWDYFNKGGHTNWNYAFITPRNRKQVSIYLMFAQCKTSPQFT